MKKILSLILAMCLVFALASVAGAQTLALNHVGATDHPYQDGSLKLAENFHGFADCGSCGDNVFDDYDFLACLGNITDESAAFAVVFNFFSVEEEGNVKSVFGKSNCCGNGTT